MEVGTGVVVEGATGAVEVPATEEKVEGATGVAEVPATEGRVVDKFLKIRSLQFQDFDDDEDPVALRFLREDSISPIWKGQLLFETRPPASNIRTRTRILDSSYTLSGQCCIE